MRRVPWNAAQIRQRFLVFAQRRRCGAPFASRCRRRLFAAIFEKDRRTRFDSCRAMRRYFRLRSKMKMSPENGGFRDSRHWRCGTPRLRSRLAVALKNRQRSRCDCHRDVPSGVIAAEGCACFAARPCNRFIDRFGWNGSLLSRDLP